jgi:LmbE family N-acetylglucosaminyl deacetylase
VPTGSYVTGARTLARRLLQARARDITDGIELRSGLVVAPHPDDETLGCGATIARKAAAGAAVTVVIVSDGRRSHSSAEISPAELAAIRRSEAERAVQRLGPKVALIFLDFPDGELSAHTEAIASRLRQFIADLAPQDILSPALAEPPSDHSTVAAAVRTAWRAEGGPGRLLEYPVWLWSQWPWTSNRSPAHLALDPLRATLATPTVKVSTDDYLDVKTEALAAYATQMTNFRDLPDWQPLPATLLERALGTHELFFPVRRSAR